MTLSSHIEDTLLVSMHAPFSTTEYEIINLTAPFLWSRLCERLIRPIFAAARGGSAVVGGPGLELGAGEGALLSPPRLCVGLLSRRNGRD